MEASEFISTVHDVFSAGRNKDLLWQTADDSQIDGKNVVVNGRPLLSFGSCSYLGLETDPRMKEAVHRAVDRYGTQFSCSRAYLSASPYGELEERLSELFGGPTLVTPTTTLGHLSSIPALVNEKDAILLDHQVHASVQMSATIARSHGTHVELVRHGDAEQLEERIVELCRTRRYVWYMLDGVFSMYGDLPDAPRLKHLLSKYEQLHLYVDDAHGMSIAGEHGRGIHLARMGGHHPRMIIASSFAKAFAAGGGCVVLPTKELRERVRMCGGTNIFSGPIQPPMLGAIRAATEIHLTDEIYDLQADLRLRIESFNSYLEERGLPLLARNETPIFFVKMGPIRMSWNMASRLTQEGFFINVSTYPAVPMKRSGLRIAVTRHHTLEELERLADMMAKHLPLALEEEGLTAEDVESNFLERSRNREGVVRTLNTARRSRGPFTPPAGLELQHATSIDALDKAEWDRLLADRGSFSATGLGMLERIFRDRPEKENNWNFHYFVVREQGRPVLATFFTDALWKDDMLMRDEVSREVEEKRKTDPYYLTSRLLAMGSLLTEGNHLYLDRNGPWRPALAWVLDEADRIMKRDGCSGLLFRDLPDNDPELDEFVLELGLVKTPVMPAYELSFSPGETEEAYLERLSKRTRKRIKEEVLDKADGYEVKVYSHGGLQPTASEVARFVELYQGIKTRKLRLNTFDLPTDITEHICRTPGWEIMALHLKPEHGGPADGRAVSFIANYRSGDRYVVMLVGVDYTYFDYFPYRQTIWQAVNRARALGCTKVSLGLDADFEKSRLGATARTQCMYVQAKDHFGGELLSQHVQSAAFKRSAATG